MRNILVQSIICLLLILFFDMVWFKMTLNIYSNMIIKIQGVPAKINFVGAILAYCFIFLGLLLIVFPGIKNEALKTKSKPMLALKYGATFGFVTYGIYNATNFTFLKGYTIPVALMDTFWGTVLFFMTTLITILI